MRASLLIANLAHELRTKLQLPGEGPLLLELSPENSRLLFEGCLTDNIPFKPAKWVAEEDEVVGSATDALTIEISFSRLTVDDHMALGYQDNLPTSYEVSLSGFHADGVIEGLVVMNAFAKITEDDDTSGDGAGDIHCADVVHGQGWDGNGSPVPADS